MRHLFDQDLFDQFDIDNPVASFTTGCLNEQHKRFGFDSINQPPREGLGLIDSALVQDQRSVSDAVIR